ncbi:MAG: DUF2628 domain-containing protein, partial [Pseudomonadota bacterium]
SKEDGRFDHIIAVPDGLAKWALILPPFWLAWHRLWFALGIYLLVTLGVLGLLNTDFRIFVLLLGGLPGLYLMLEGNTLRRSRLEAQNWAMVGVREANSAEEAVERWLADWKEPVAISAQMAAVHQNSPTGSHPAKPTREHEAQTFGLFPERAE